MVEGSQNVDCRNLAFFLEAVPVYWIYKWVNQMDLYPSFHPELFQLDIMKETVSWKDLHGYKRRKLCFTVLSTNIY